MMERRTKEIYESITNGGEFLWGGASNSKDMPLLAKHCQLSGSIEDRFCFGELMS